MSKERGKKFGLAAAGVAGLMTVGTAPALEAQAADGKRPATLKERDEDCPSAAIGALRTIVGANTDYSTRSGRTTTKKKAAKKKAARKKTAKKTAKKATRKRALKRPVRKIRKKTAKKAMKRRAPARRDPC